MSKAIRKSILLEASLNRHAALEFLRAGGKIVPAAFKVSSSDLSIVKSEADATRAAMTNEISRLRARYLAYGYSLAGAPDEVRNAYLGISAEQDNLLELRHQWVALGFISHHANRLRLAAAANAQEDHRRRVRASCDAILARLSNIKCPPLREAARFETLAGHLLMHGAERLSPLELGERILNQADVVGTGLLGELCAAASRS